MTQPEMEPVATPTTVRAWFHAPIAEFVELNPHTILGQLTANSDFSVDPTQRDAWLIQVELLRAVCRDLSGTLLLEFNIPRMGSRIDAVILSGPIVFVLEFKIGARTFDRSAIEQVWDYALDLKNFHEASHDAPIIPILVASSASECPAIELRSDRDRVFRPVLVHPERIRDVLDLAHRTIDEGRIDNQQWARAPYRPTPTIIEAARALYAQHSVDAIARFDAGAQNLHRTSLRIEELIEDAKATGRKVICFVTGVPGAGKTLVGLNVATQRRDEKISTHAVFLSGNAPLVAVLREALTRDEVDRLRGKGRKIRKGEVATSVKSFIQNVHHFRDASLVDTDPPDEHVVIFDEAQRAWNLKQTANFMQRKKKRPGFSQSEPEFLISCMDRHQDWAVIICLVGGGQEINTGEAGIDAWLDAVQEKYPHWACYISSRLADSEYAAGGAVDRLRTRDHAHMDDSLHLAVSMRSFRAEHVSGFVKALLDRDQAHAYGAFQEFSARYPIAVTRDLELAKNWIRSHARGSERFGIVASSRAHRLKPHAIDIRVNVDPIHWFLNDRSDTRSSYYMEDAATEFQVQGLELDWACVTWDGDLRSTNSGWSFHEFRGHVWQNIHNEDNRRYLRNAYRVLLTRARQGMVIFVPPGSKTDPTRAPEFYDATFDFLRSVGLPVLS